MHSQSTVLDGGSSNGLPLIIEGKPFVWHEQYISGAQLKELAHISLHEELYLSIGEPWTDELVANLDQVDLARVGLEQFYVKKLLHYTINEQEFTSNKQFIKGLQIRKEGRVPTDHQLFLSIPKPWEDELVKDNEWIDLARRGKEHFYSKAIPTGVVLIVNAREKPWEKRTINFQEVVILAEGEYVDDGLTAYTVTYDNGPKENPEGSMDIGEEVNVKNKMVFNVKRTIRS
jgi:hypothetical protein